MSNPKRSKCPTCGKFLNNDVAALREQVNILTDERDRKAHDCWLITTTDREGFHRQLPITFDDMRELVRLWIEETI